MKKTIVALAALAAMGVASAQSSVTLSGTLDAGLSKNSGGELQLMGSVAERSNVTASGTEDLGGGLKAAFYVSTAFDPTGSENSGLVSNNDTAIGNNGAYLRVSGGFGSLTLGNPEKILSVNTLTPVTIDRGVIGMTAANVLSANLSNNNRFSANSVQYVSPSISGLSLQLEAALSEKDNVDSGSAVGVQYANGPVNAAVTYYKSTAAVANADAQYEVVQVSGAYNLGPAKVFLNYQEDDGAVAGTKKVKAVLAGVKAPVGPGNFWAQYGSSKQDGSDRNNVVTLGYSYSLSKRTSLYTAFGYVNDPAKVSYSLSGKNAYNFGVQHSF